VSEGGVFVRRHASKSAPGSGTAQGDSAVGQDRRTGLEVVGGEEAIGVGVPVPEAGAHDDRELSGGCQA
jgi:hypothetical protein